jgi:RNA polymerase sigma factor (sigma-70 family)
MDEASDQQLLREFAENRSEAAFAELVHRHIDLVYSAALRLVFNPHLAQEVTQGVFVALAQNDAKLTDCAVLAGWLHRTARNLAANVVRSEVRRRAREQEAVAMNDATAGEPAPDWEIIAPQLDAALGELTEADRDAILLRYFNRKSAREIGGLLGTSEEAAQKRIQRAVEKLRENLARRGVAAGGLASAIAAHGVQAAPSGLMAIITAAPASTTLAAAKILFMTTTQKIFVTTAIVAAIGVGAYEAHQAETLRRQNTALQQQFAQQVLDLQRERDDASNRVASLSTASAPSNHNSAELLKLRGEVTRLKSENAALAAPPKDNPTQSAAKRWLERVQRLRDYSNAHPEAVIPEMKYLSDRDWLNATDRDLETDKDYRRAMASLRDAASSRAASQIMSAVQKFEQSSNGPLTDLSQLQNYFGTAPDPDILQRWAVLPARELPNLSFSGDWIISQKAPVDEDYDTRYGIGPNGMGNTGPGSFKAPQFDANDAKIVQPAIQAYSAANNGAMPATPAQIEPYLTSPEQRAAYQRLANAALANAPDTSNLADPQPPAATPNINQSSPTNVDQ